MTGPDADSSPVRRDWKSRRVLLKGALALIGAVAVAEIAFGDVESARRGFSGPPFPPSLTPTNTPTDTPTNTPTNTWTNTPTDTPTNTQVPPSPTWTCTSTPTDVPPSPTWTFTSTPTDVPV